MDLEVAAVDAIVIGDDVFLGQNVVVLGGVRIGDGATVGGGSTVNKDVPAGKLVVARARQTIVDGWQRPKKTKKG